jgi:hypothetical protein
MEFAALSGLLGLGYVVSKSSQKKKTLPPSTDQLQPSLSLKKEPFVGSQTGSKSAPTQPVQTKGFGPELDLMYKMPNGHTYPSEPSNGPYGTAFGYASNKPPYAPQLFSGTTPSPSPIDSNTPMTEYRSDNTEADPQYIDSDFVISPLSGQRIASKEFKHNNMQPYFGGRVKQNVAVEANRGVLDAYNGSGSLQLKKREVENMFETARTPYGNVNGMEEHTEFFQNRVQSTMPEVRKGERPFEQIRVGPGLGEKGGFSGKGGFQDLNVNEIMRPKDTNELRVATNPKESYLKPMISGSHFVGKSAEANDIGEVRKYRADRFYIDETGERYFVTNGDQLKDMVRSTQVMPHTNRPETTTDYTGIATSQDFSEGYVTGSYRDPMTQQYGGAGYRNADMTSYYTNDTDADKADYGKASYEIRPNERNETSERVMALNPAPADNQLNTIHYTDDARPTRRSETIGNIRMTGTPYGYVDRAPHATVWDSKDIARTTVRETTIYNDRMGNFGGDGAAIPNRLKVYDPEDIAKPTQKSQISAISSWTGPSGSGAVIDKMDYTFAQNMRSNPHKEQIAKGRKPISGNGSVATFNGDPGKQLSKKLDADYINDRALAVNRSTDLSPGVGDMGRIEFRVPLKLDVSRERNTYSAVSAVDNNPYMQSLKKNAELDEKTIREYRPYLG